MNHPSGLGKVFSSASSRSYPSRWGIACRTINADKVRISQDEAQKVTVYLLLLACCLIILPIGDMYRAFHWQGNNFESHSQRRVRPYGLRSTFFVLSNLVRISLQKNRSKNVKKNRGPMDLCLKKTKKLPSPVKPDFFRHLQMHIHYVTHSWTYFFPQQTNEVLLEREFLKRYWLKLKFLKKNLQRQLFVPKIHTPVKPATRTQFIGEPPVR